MACPRLDRVGYVAILLDNDHIYLAFHISYQLFDMHAYAARAAVLKDHDRAAMRAFEQCLERVERSRGHMAAVELGTRARRLLGGDLRDRVAAGQLVPLKEAGEAGPHLGFGRQVVAHGAVRLKNLLARLHHQNIVAHRETLTVAGRTRSPARSPRSQRSWRDFCLAGSVQPLAMRGARPRPHKAT